MATRLWRSLMIGLFLVLVWPAQLVLALEGISHFDSDIVVNRDTSVEITETIQYYTTESKHGIYRYIPTRYSRNGFNYTTSITDIRIEDQNGEAITYERSWENGNVVLKIGEADSTFTGPKTYIIRYKVSNALQVPSNTTDADEVQMPKPELFWDITGEGWQIDISSSSATVKAPGATITKVDCFSGEVGGNDRLCKSSALSATTAEFVYPKTITYGDNMTVAIQYEDASAFDFPTEFEKMLAFIWDNLSLLPLLLPGVGLAMWWWKKGRDKEYLSWNVFNHNAADPQQTAPLWNMRHIPMVYEPIKELTPGEAGAIHDEKADNEDVIAEIIDLARQKYLKIERVESKKLFFIPETDYVFTRLKEDSGKLPKQQQYLLTHLFDTGNVVKMSTLKGSFYTHMEGTKNRIMQSLKTKGLFFDDPKDSRGLGMSVAIVSLIVTGWWGIHLLTLGLFWALPLFGLSAVVALIAGYNLPAKTATGSNFAWQVRGLRRSIQYGAWREKLKEKNLFFEEVLPFAIALGVVDKLAKDMKDLNVPEPTYIPSSGMGSWATSSFINSFSAEAASSLSYNPSSSSWSSGSGFSGGGSSGGGGGGGGGGSW